MNLNKYDAQGYPYTAEEAAQRAADIFGVRYVVKSPTKPYDIGRNVKKRAAKAAWANLRSNLK